MLMQVIHEAALGILAEGAYYSNQAQGFRILGSTKPELPW